MNRPADDIVGKPEIAELFRVTRRCVSMWVARPDFPRPLARPDFPYPLALLINGRPVWSADEVFEWRAARSDVTMEEMS